MHWPAGWPIINHGKVVAEGTPAALKRSIGADVIIAQIEGDTDTARDIVRSMQGVEGVEAHGNEITISVREGASYLSAIAVALNDGGVKVRELTLRTPTLDDVFPALHRRAAAGGRHGGRRRGSRNERGGK